MVCGQTRVGGKKKDKSYFNILSSSLCQDEFYAMLQCQTVVESL